MKYTVLVLSLSLPISAQAFDSSFNESASLVIHAGSYHFDDSHEWNQINPGIGIRRSVSGQYFLTAGAYYNSIRRGSLYAGVGKTLFVAGPVAISLMGGVVTGYELPLIPFILPEISVRYGQYAAMLNFLPEVSVSDYSSPSLISLSFAKIF
jgi:hypothetical protein